MNMLELGGARRTPYIQQNEASECALACLAMVSSYHGYKIDLGILRQRYGASLKGVTLKHLMKVAEDIGFNCRPLRGEIDDLIHLSLPVILHWNLNHFVVLTKISQGISGLRYHIHDPASGVLKMSVEDVSRQFTGVVLDLQKSESFQPKVEMTKLRITHLWTSMAGFWQTIRQVVLLSIVLQLVALAAPFYMQLAIDTVFPSFDRNLLIMLALGFGGLAIINFLTGWLRSLILVSLNNSLSYQVIVNLFRHLSRLPLPWFEKRHVGDILSRFSSTKPITDLLSQGMIAAFIDGVMALVTLGLMFVYSGVLALVAVTALILYGLLRLIFLQALRLRNINVITTAAHENTVFIETIRGIATIKAFGQEGSRQRLWQNAKADHINAQIKLGRLSAGFDGGNQLLVALERVLFIYLAISMALDAKLTVGMVFAFQAYKQQFLDAGVRLIEQAMNYNLIGLHLGRISDIALTPIERPDTSSHQTPTLGSKPISPRLELRNVYFSYGAGEPSVLKGINLTIAPGESVVFVGPSGGGKTTLLKIIMGLLTPSSGEVLIDGIPLQAYGVSRWRGQSGSVAQDDALFAGSLADNISFFDSKADMDRVRRVARLASIDADVEQMPMQYHTLVGDMGSALSGGQKQRILLARAFYNDPSILFIDEGTAHVDPEAEQRIIEMLASLEITRCVVSHRASVSEFGGRILTVRDGQVSEVTALQKVLSFISATRP